MLWQCMLSTECLVATRMAVAEQSVRRCRAGLMRLHAHVPIFKDSMDASAVHLSAPSPSGWQTASSMSRSPQVSPSNSALRDSSAACIGLAKHRQLLGSQYLLANFRRFLRSKDI